MDELLDQILRFWLRPLEKPFRIEQILIGM
jgi:hypothetical protein